MDAVWVIPSFDEAEDGVPGFLPRRKHRAIDELAFEGGKKALAHRVVIAVADRSHRWAHSCVFATLTKGQRRILRSLVGMVDRALRPAPLNGHVQSREHQFGLQVNFHRPSCAEISALSVG